MTREECTAVLTATSAWKCESQRIAAPELYAALEATLERETVLLARIEKLQLMGCSRHKAAAAVAEGERAAVCVLLRAIARNGHSDRASLALLRAADAIEAGAHRADEQSMNETGSPRSSKATDAGLKS